MQISAVEFLIQQLAEYFPHEIGGIHLMVEKAKDIEQQQIIDAFNSAYGGDDNLDGNEYYNKTFKQNNNEKIK